MASTGIAEKISELNEAALKAVMASSTLESLYQVKVQYWGKQGSAALLMKEMGKLAPDERKATGLAVNAERDKFDTQYAAKEGELKRAALNSKLESERIDVTLPGVARERGVEHPTWRVGKEICDIFAKLGFSVRTGPHVEKDFYNFDALNIPPDHASRDLQDTFYVEDGVQRKPGEYAPWILRTHTSPVQIRTMLTEKPPLRILSPGGVYRSDSDMSHSPNFHQVEGLLIDEEVSMADLKGTLGFFSREFFGPDVQIRLRPAYFPFVEPGAEMDASCPFCKAQGCGMCKGSGWIELGGCGMVHPVVFKHAGVEYPKWNGFAFGLGVERMAVVKYGVGHISLLTENDLRFLEQFRS